MKFILKHMLIFFLTLVIAGSIAYYSIRIFTQSADEVILPELREKNIIYVLETLTAMGLNVKLDATLYDDRVPRYSVISQSPEPGTTLKKGRNVTIFLSKGKKENLMPDLRLVELETAKILLEKNEFKTGTISYTHSDTIKKNRIITQYPKPFMTIPKESGCNLLVSLGNHPINQIMPDLEHLSIQKASNILDQMRLSISNITSKTDQKKENGLVLFQHPAPGNRVNSQTSIKLVVSATEENQIMEPKSLKGIRYYSHKLGLGYLNYHVRVSMVIQDMVIDLYNEIKKPGEVIQILIPPAYSTTINIYIDHQLVRIIRSDPWKKDILTGEIHSWQLSPLQSYLPILQN